MIDFRVGGAVRLTDEDEYGLITSIDEDGIQVEWVGTSSLWDKEDLLAETQFYMEPDAPSPHARLEMANGLGVGHVISAPNHSRALGLPPSHLWVVIGVNTVFGVDAVSGRSTITIVPLNHDGERVFIPLNGLDPLGEANIVPILTAKVSK